MNDEEIEESRPFALTPSISLVLSSALYLIGRLACDGTIDKLASYCLSGIFVVALLCDLIINKFAALGVIWIQNWKYPVDGGDS